MTPWEIQATELVNCNCDYGCPCQFNGRPTQGDCHAIGCYEITKGHYGDIDLAGLRFGGIFQWPGAIHEGKGKCQPFVDIRASNEQRDALLKIMSGYDTDPMATVFAVFASTMEQVFDPIFAPIEFDVDVDARRGHYRVEGLLETNGEPIINPVTGDEHRARIDLTDGFEYEIAEVGSASSQSQGEIPLTLQDSYGQFAHIHLNNHGVVRHRSV